MRVWCCLNGHMVFRELRLEGGFWGGGVYIFIMVAYMSERVVVRSIIAMVTYVYRLDRPRVHAWSTEGYNSITSPPRRPT